MGVENILQKSARNAVFIKISQIIFYVELIEIIYQKVADEW